MKRRWYGVQPDERALREIERLEPQEIGAKEQLSQPPVDGELKPAIPQEWRRVSLMADDGQVTPEVAQKVAAALGIPVRVLWAEPGSSGEDNGNG